MAFDPEAIQVALFTRFSTIAGLKTKTRQPIPFDQLTSTAQPALELLSISDAADRKYAVPSVHTLRAIATIYVREPNDRTQTVETTLWSFVKLVDAALLRQPGEVSPEDNPETTLGLPTLYRCFRRDAEIHHGVGQQQAAVSMTIEMVAPE